MAFALFVVLTLLSVAASRDNLYSHKKHGCFSSPEICTPPEHCSKDGNCELYYRNEWSTLGNQLSLLETLRELEARGYEYKTLEDDEKYPIQDDRFDPRASTLSLEDYITALKRIRQDESSQFENVNNPQHRYNRPTVEENNDYHREYRRSQPDSLSVDAIIMKMREKELVRKAQRVLKENGVTLSDLNKKELESLAKILADHLAKNPYPDYKEIDNEYEEKRLKNVDGEKEQQPIMKSDEKKNFEPVQGLPADLNENDSNAAEVDRDVEKDNIESDAAIPSPSPVRENSSNHKLKNKNKTLYVVIIVVGATVLLIIIVTIISCAIHAYRTKQNGPKKFIGSSTNDLGDDYQELCRQRYATKNSEHTESSKDMLNDSSVVTEPLITRSYPVTRPNEAEPKSNMAAHSIGYGEVTRNSSVSSTSWSEEPVTASLDISTGHAVLSYMEDHLNNKDRLDKEWEDICEYEADNITTATAIAPQNSRKNRSIAALPYDHNRIKLNPENNHLQSDYINASSVIDNDPRRPLYIAAQGPLASTIPDFWQMMWEKGCVAIVMLTPLVEEGVNQCARYWPDEGSCTYHNFEIHLVSEHIWCEDYLVRSLYLKHLPSGETRTVTQFHFLSWPNDGVPSTAKPLLELRRKVTKCYKGHNAPVLVHCSDGVGRTGTYILLDLVIDRMLKGAKEIDIAATLEHIRDQRVGMVHTKDQFEFALTAVAEEVNAILKTLLR